MPATLEQHQKVRQLTEKIYGVDQPMPSSVHLQPSDEIAGLSEKEISALVDEGGKLHEQIRPLKKKEERLDAIKAILRNAAGNREIQFLGKQYVASIEQKDPTICRCVDEKDVPRVATLAGESLTTLFTIHPSKGNAKSFELNVLKELSKKSAQALIDLLTVPATAWVRFS